MGRQPVAGTSFQVDGIPESVVDAAMGVLMMFGKSSKGVSDEMNHSGAYTNVGRHYPRMQVLTVEDLFNKESFNDQH